MGCPPDTGRAERYSVDHDTPVAAATSVTLAPASTARTASRRCSTTDNTTSANLGLPESRRPAETSNSGWPKQTTVAHQLASDCRTSHVAANGETLMVSEAYYSRFNVIRAAQRLREVL